MISYPFESENKGTAEAPVYDRAITAEQERAVNKLLYTNGVFSEPANSLQVTSAGGMNVEVAPGGCCIEGAFGYETSSRTFTLNDASGSGSRIVRIIARFDLSTEMRNIDIYKVEGMAATTPTAPEITQQPNYYEIVLADIRVGKGAGEVTNADITDQRENDELCGIVVPATPLDLTALYNQYQASLDEYMDLVRSALDETTAGNLQNQINESYSLNKATFIESVGDDLNDYVEPGNYACGAEAALKSLKNSPTTSAFYLKVSNPLPYNGSQYRAQEIHLHSSDIRWYRMSNNGGATWNEWDSGTYISDETIQAYKELGFVET